MIQLFIHWNINPAIFHIGEHEVRWYGLLFAAAFFFGYYVMRKYFRLDNIKEELLDKLSVYIFLGTLIGARLGHCLFYEPSYYFAHPIKFLFVWEGGLASHGASIGILIALYLYARKIKVPFLFIVDRVVIVAALGGFFVRMGNFMNSEIYGTHTSLPWGVIFERNGELLPKHPTQIYEALAYLAIFVFLNYYFLKHRTKEVNGKIFGIFLILLFVTRFLIEFIKNNQESFESNMSLNMGQWLSIPFILVGLGLLIYLKYSKKESVK